MKLKKVAAICDKAGIFLLFDRVDEKAAGAGDPEVGAERNTVDGLLPPPMSPGAESAVLAAIADICVSMKAEGYLQLPENISHEVPIMLDSKTKKAYERFERDLLLEVDENIITAGTAGVLTGKLLQFCNGAVYGSEGQIVPVHDCKLEAHMELLERLDGEPALTFYGYQHDRDRLLERLAKTKLRVRAYKGAEDEEAWNSGQVDVLLVHPASCAYGLNLQAGGRHVVWYGLN